MQGREFGWYIYIYIYIILSTFNGNLVIYCQISNMGAGSMSGKVNSYQINSFFSQYGSVAAAICRMARKLGNGGSGTVDAWFKGKHRSCWATESCIKLIENYSPRWLICMPTTQQLQNKINKNTPPPPRQLNKKQKQKQKNKQTRRQKI